MTDLELATRKFVRGQLALRERILRACFDLSIDIERFETYTAGFTETTRVIAVGLGTVATIETVYGPGRILTSVVASHAIIAALAPTQ